MPLFSIVTVCLNDLENLRITVSSVKGQNFKDYEYVIVDGSSIDGSVDFIREFSPDRFISESDDGIFDAMNKGLQMCSGEYICFMNAGDIFYDESVLDKISEEIKKASHIPFFYGDVFYSSVSRYIIRQPSILTNFLLFRTTVCHQAWFLRREIYNEAGGFDRTLNYKGDREFLMRIILEKKISYKHLDLVIAEYKGCGFSVINKGYGHKELEIIRQKYFSTRQIFWFSICLKLIDILKKSPLYLTFRSLKKIF